MPKTSVRARDIDGRYHEVPADTLRWRPSVYGIMIRDSQIVLSPQRDGRYDLPGGGIETGEMPEAALQREVHEETGLLTERPRLLHATSTFFKMPDKPDDFIQSIMLYYTLDIVGGVLSAEHYDALETIHLLPPAWMDLQRLDDISLVSSFDWRPVVRIAAG